MTDPVAPPPDPGLAPPGEAGVDLGRRSFFRRFAGELVETAATVVGAAQALQRSSTELAGALLDPTRVGAGEPIADAGGPDATAGAPGAAFRTAFRVETATIHFVDQRFLPGQVVEHVADSAAEVAWAIHNEVVRGGPAAGQAAAVGLAMTAARMRSSKPYARRATLRGAANALRNSAPTLAAVERAVDRMMAAYAVAGELADDGEPIAAAMRDEADRIVAEATLEHGRLVEHGLAALPPQSAEGPLRILAHGPSGTLAGGQVGLGLAIAIAAHHAGREVRVIVPEGRPSFAGARVTCWELAGAGVPHTLVADAAAPSLIASGEVDLVLLAGDRVAANGDAAAAVGSYPLAAVAARHGVPVLVAAPDSAVDPATADGAAIRIGSRPDAELARVQGVAIALAVTEVRVPAHDVTPAGLVTGYLTGDGLRHPPFGTMAAGEAG